MSYHELSPAEEKRFDHLVETKSAHEVWEIIRAERSEIVGAQALKDTAEVTEEKPTIKHGTNRRGGRSYPEPSDSERDPNWNTAPAPVGDPTFAESQEAFKQFAQAAHRATIESNIRINDLDPVLAAARFRAAEERRQDV